MEIEFSAPRKRQALASVTIVMHFGAVEITIADWRLLRRKKDNELFLGAPEFGTPAKAGGRNAWDYHPVISLDPASWEKVQAMVLDAWRARGERV
jgi:hypothetical protein